MWKYFCIHCISVSSIHAEINSELASSIQKSRSETRSLCYNNLWGSYYKVQKWEIADFNRWWCCKMFGFRIKSAWTDRNQLVFIIGLQCLRKCSNKIEVKICINLWLFFLLLGSHFGGYREKVQEQCTKIATTIIFHNFFFLLLCHIWTQHSDTSL